MARGMLSCTLGVALLTAAAHADTLFLENGDRLTGVLQSIAQGVVTIETGYAGTVEVQQSAVTGMETETPRALRLDDGAIVEGALETREQGTGLVRPDGGWQPVPPAAVVALADAGETPSEPEPEKPRRWSGAVDSGLTHQTGNTDTTDFHLATKVKREGARNTLTLSFNAAYGEADDIMNTRRFAGEAKWQYYLRPRLYWYLLGAAERDDGRKLDLRAQGGTGLGYDFIDNDTRTLSVDAGLNFTHEQWAPYTPWGREEAKDAARNAAFSRLNQLLLEIGQSPFGVTFQGLQDLAKTVLDLRDPLRDTETLTEEYVNLRIGAEYAQKLFKASTLSEQLVLLPNLEEFGEFRATSVLEFLTPISDRLSLRCALETEYDSLAEESGVDPWDNTFITSLRYEF